MMWHAVSQIVVSRAARSRDSAIHVACELPSQSCDVRQILEPNGFSIERLELDEHFDEGRFPGLRRDMLVPSDGRLPKQLSVHQPHDFSRFCREFCATTEQPCARLESQLASE
jgi:hypothetical protein